jgi:hypothetical protein
MTGSMLTSLAALLRTVAFACGSVPKTGSVAAPANDATSVNEIIGVRLNTTRRASWPAG